VGAGTGLDVMEKRWSLLLPRFEPRDHLAYIRVIVLTVLFYTDLKIILKSILIR
jgi:hypothetical protein